MPTVQLAFSPAPRYVRTARLVSVAVARRAGVADEHLDAVRLAVGEACARAVARHRRHGIAELVRVVMSDDGPYTVRVLDASTERVPATAGLEDADEAEDADRMANALLVGLVDDLEVRAGEDGTEVRMVWPVRRRLSATTRGARITDR